jgi:hypothetical protein
MIEDKMMRYLDRIDRLIERSDFFENQCRDKLDRELLYECFERFDKTYKDTVKDYIIIFETKNNDKDRNEALQALVRKIKMTLNRIKIIKNKTSSFEWSENSRTGIVELIAHILALWTLKNTEHYEKMVGIET